MADEKIKSATPGRQILTAKVRPQLFNEAAIRTAAIPSIRPGVRVSPEAPARPPAPPQVQPPQPPTPQPAPPPVVPTASADNPFGDLPMPSPGDRIKADDFKKLSQSLRIIFDAYALSGILFGRSFGEVRLALVSQQYEIDQVMTVFGNVIDDPNDGSFDSRRVIQVVPVMLGERRVSVVLTEAVETRRFAPNLLGMTYRDASERLQALLGDAALQGGPRPATQFVGLSLAEAIKTAQ